MGQKNTNLISKSLPNLSSSKWELLAIVIVQVLEIYKNTLCSFWSHIPISATQNWTFLANHRRNIITERMEIFSFDRGRMEIFLPNAKTSGANRCLEHKIEWVGIRKRVLCIRGNNAVFLNLRTKFLW